ncbi:hypothetical protein BDZ94DRAFT_1319395 [Collybia nuda]|uniref:DUF1295-domain-containing protein n=1 Tax=Collybia nuda TaxID=64659 RepID=A0A9P5YC41_9AGAR|nr:hypothetical protein BDZ94DRAFT_1319395 [Collybia nuda]
MVIFDVVPPEYRWPVQFCTLATITTYVLSLITSNVSQVDRLWTFLPTIYAAYYALLPLLPNEQPFLFLPYTPRDLEWAAARDFSPRALLIFSLIVAWMCRLTYNTNRRGLFNIQEEDYRWAVLRKQLPPWLFQITNLTFISVTQNVLLLLLGLPTRVASVLQPHTALTLSDYTLSFLAIVVLVIEFTADNQQYAFQTYKHAFLAAEKGKASMEAYDAQMQWPGARLDWKPEDARRGFLTKGFWSYSRHPNSACEQAFWCIITLMPLLSPSPPNITYSEIDLSLLPTLSMIFEDFPHALIPFFQHLLGPLTHVVPALALLALIFSSLIFTESISMTKYPGYKAYRERVGMLGIISTLEKGLLLKWNGRREEVDAIVWGKVKKLRKAE